MADSRIDELRRRLERDPGSRLFAQLAEEHRKAGDHAEAVRVARAGLVLHPSYPSARLTLGRALLDSGDPAAARAELEAALRDAPDNILASRFLGQALEALGELGPALAQLQRTLKMAPGDRQLEGQIVSLQSRLRAPRPPAAASTAPDVTAPMPRPAAPAPVAEAEDEGPLPPTIRIHMPGDRAAVRSRPAPAPPPLPIRPPSPPPPPAVEAAVEPPAPIQSGVTLPHGARAEPPPPTAPEPPGRPPSEVPAAEPRPALFAEPFYESDVAPTMPRTVQPDAEPVEATAEPLAEPAASPGEGPPQDPAAAPFSSSTLAELYLRQGLFGRAVEVYRQVVAEEPGNERARARLAEIEGSAASPGERDARRRALEATIARLEALLAAVRRRRG